MRRPHQLPSRVRCNRGFGWSFWMLMGITVVWTLVWVSAASLGGPPAAWITALAGGGVAAVGLVVVRASLPRLDIMPAHGALRTRRRTVPCASIARIEVSGRNRSGVWARLDDDDGRNLAQMSLAGSLLAVPTAEQWMEIKRDRRPPGVD